MAFRLGRLPHDPSVVAVAPSLANHRFALLASQGPPAAVDRWSTPYSPGLYDNDLYPDCTACAYVNYARGVASINGFDIPVSTSAPRDFYAESVGIDPSDLAAIGASDGAVLIDVMRRQLTNGFQFGTQLFAGNWAVVPIDRKSLAMGVNFFGGLEIGLHLYQGDMAIPNVWDTDYTPGTLVGGHATHLWDYRGLGDTDIVRISTWGTFQNATWRWVESRIAEAYVVLWRQLSRASGLSIGVDFDQLATETHAMNLALTV